MARFFGRAPTARRALFVVALALPSLLHAAGPTGCAGRAFDDAGLDTAWRTLRIVDCARCHGRDYDGLAAPSVIDYVRTQSRARFDHIVLDGDPPRGMPGYRNNTLVAAAIDELYRYFAARAAGTVAPGAPCGAPGARASASGIGIR